MLNYQRVSILTKERLLSQIRINITQGITVEPPDWGLWLMLVESLDGQYMVANQMAGESQGVTPKETGSQSAFFLVDFHAFLIAVWGRLPTGVFEV
jgi:hypothetical protein